MGIGIHVSILKADGRSYSNGGVSAEHDEALLVLDDGSGVFDPKPGEPVVKIVPGNLPGTVKAVVAEQANPGEWSPVEHADRVGPMMGGCYIESSDARFGEQVVRTLCESGETRPPRAAAVGPVALHDRFESAAKYASYD